MSATSGPIAKCNIFFFFFSEIRGKIFGYDGRLEGILPPTETMRIEKVVIMLFIQLQRVS